MFFRDVTIVPLASTRYDFADAELRAAGEAFIRDLVAVDATVPVHRFAPLGRISASIQY